MALDDNILEFIKAVIKAMESGMLEPELIEIIDIASDLRERLKKL